jgi:hypothetical protein
MKLIAQQLRMLTAMSTTATVTNTIVAKEAPISYDINLPYGGNVSSDE